MEKFSTIKCEKCNQDFSRDQIRLIDDHNFCVNCLFNNHPPFAIYPIGFVKNALQRGYGFGLNGNRNDISEIHLFLSQSSFLEKLGDEKKIDIVYYLHQQRKSIKSVFHRGWDGKKVGVFASRTPERLNPIAITRVELVKIKENILYVKGLDAINDTPILDIKMAL